MIVHRRIPWVVIAAFILLACISSSTSVNLQKLRRTTTETPVIIKVIHKYSDDEFTQVVSSNCTHNCENSRDKFSSDIDEALTSTKQDNFRKLKKLQKVDKHIELNLLKSLRRTKRNLENDYLARRNASDYYAQRRAVMERYYARQREINARYANRTAGNITRLRYNGVHYPVTNNATRFRIEYGYPNKNSTTENTTSRYSRIDLTNNRETLNNRISTELNNRRDIAPENDLDSKSDVNFIQRSNIERNALNYLTTTPCGPTSGTIAPKTRQKSKHCNETEESEEDSVITNTPGSERWGECKGKLVYQHNLLLGLTGPSNLNAIFEVIIEGSVCITCVETLRYNETKAKVALVSGGRGFEYAKLKLEGHKNEGFSYIIKIWGVKKVGQDCGNVE